VFLGSFVCFCWPILFLLAVVFTSGVCGSGNTERKRKSEESFFVLSREGGREG